MRENHLLIKKLLIIDFRNEFPYKLSNEDDYQLTGDELNQLIQIASFLSLSNEPSDLSLAYEIITKLFKNFHEEHPNLYSIAHVILSRLGNFPNRDLLKKYGFDFVSPQAPPVFQLEILGRELENSVSLSDNKKIILTDFQKGFFDVLTREKFFSVSAPTSAGKSFVFVLSIIQRLLNNSTEKIVLIVPTRALIQELSLKIFHAIKEYNLINRVLVRSIPAIDEDFQSFGVVFVVTQERLSTLLYEENLHLDTIFIDEAQEIQSNRGIVLQNTLELVKFRFSNINMFFASPLIENPDIFNSMLGLNFNEKQFIEQVSPVGQNIIFLSSIKNKPRKVNLALHRENSNFDLGHIELDFNFRNNHRIIDLARKITHEDELTLIYVNDATRAEELALNMVQMLDDIQDTEIELLIQFIQEDVHTEYSLIQCLKKGVAYHYRYIPTTVRTEIEKLTESGKLRFVFCTSTLLQGVNLPAKNIILYNPSKGRGKPMTRADFLNLIGRAGRLKQEFQGNIWCIEPDEWKEKSFQGAKLQKIEPYYSKSLTNNANEILELARDPNKSNEFMPVFGKFFVETILDGKVIEEFSSFESYKDLITIYQVCQAYNLALPPELTKKNYSIHPLRLHELYRYLNQFVDVSLFMPLDPNTVGANIRIREIFQIINKKLLLIDNNSYKLHAQFAYKWLHDEPLNNIIDNRHTYIIQNIDPNQKINKTIRDVLEVIENELRFNYVVLTGAYIDILKYILKQRNQPIDYIPNIPLFLECGTANPLVINLISLGLSRLTSIKLKNSRTFSCAEPTAINCFNALQKTDIDKLDIPAICKQEIKNFLK